MYRKTSISAFLLAAACLSYSSVSSASMMTTLEATPLEAGYGAFSLIFDDANNNGILNSAETISSFSGVEFSGAAGIADGVYDSIVNSPDLEFGSLWQFGIGGSIAGSVVAGISSWSYGYSANPVPVPAALWLFVTALMGLAGIGKRSKAS